MPKNLESMLGKLMRKFKKVLGLTKAEGVVVFRGHWRDSPAELSGIKVKAVIKEVDIFEIRTVVGFREMRLEKTLPTPEFYRCHV